MLAQSELDSLSVGPIIATIFLSLLKEVEQIPPTYVGHNLKFPKIVVVVAEI